MKKLTPRDKYLRKRFGITEAEYNEQLALQGGGCRICGSTPKTRALHVDHDHGIENWAISSHKVAKGVWKSYPDYGENSKLDFEEVAETKPKARAKVKARLRRISVRGIICFNCNRALQKFYDNPDRMKKAADYLEKYNSWVAGQIEQEGIHDDRPADPNS